MSYIISIVALCIGEELDLLGVSSIERKVCYAISENSIAVDIYGEKEEGRLGNDGGVALRLDGMLLRQLASDVPVSECRITVSAKLAYLPY